MNELTTLEKALALLALLIIAGLPLWLHLLQDVSFWGPAFTGAQP